MLLLHRIASHHLGLAAENWCSPGTSAPSAMESTGGWDAYLGNGRGSVILTDTWAIWAIFPAIIYPAQISDGIGDYANCSFFPQVEATFLVHLKLLSLLLRRGRQGCLANRLHIKGLSGFRCNFSLKEHVLQWLFSIIAIHIFDRRVYEKNVLRYTKV